MYELPLKDFVSWMSIANLTFYLFAPTFATGFPYLSIVCRTSAFVLTSSISLYRIVLVLWFVLV